jgi:hypothetical protein
MQDSAYARLSREAEPIVLAAEPTDYDCAEVVLGVYTSARSQDAFEAAVRSYRERNPDASIDGARRAAAKIICGKA